MKNKRNILYLSLFFTILVSVLLVSKILPNSFAEDTKISVETKLMKYNNYYLSDEDKGTLVQYKIKNQIEYQENQEKVPMQKSETFVNFGQIDEQYPENVKVIAKDTAIEVKSEYDKKSGQLRIQRDNPNDSEEYIVIADYNTYTEEKEERAIEVKVQTKGIWQEEEEKQIKEETQCQDIVTENTADLTSIEYETQEIGIGGIKSNLINGTNYVTQYEQKEEVVVSKKEAEDSLIIRENNTFLETEKNIEIPSDKNIIYKSTKIQEKQIKELLGEEGILEILDSEQNLMARIDKDTEFDENGTVEISYEDEIDSLIMQTSHVEKEGILTLAHTKEIKSIPQMQNINVKTTINEQYEIINSLKEPETRVDFKIDNSNWSNVQQNEVTFTIELDARTLKNNLFKNPSLRIELPNEVEKVVLGSSSATYTNGLELQEPYTEINDNGNIEIVANLTGAQTEYVENEMELTTQIQLKATIILKKDIETVKTSAKLMYANQYTVDETTETGSKEIELQLESYQEEKREEKEEQQELTIEERPSESVRKNKIQKVEKDDIELNTYAQIGEKKIVNGDTIHEAEVIKYVIQVKNKSQETINQMKVNCQVPEGTVFATIDKGDYLHGKYEYIEYPESKECNFPIEKLKPGQTQTGYYEVVVKKLGEEEKEKQITNTISVKVGEEEIKNQVLQNKIVSSELEVSLKSYIDREGQNQFAYFLHIKNTSGHELKNVAVETSELQKEMEVLSCQYYDDEQTETEDFGRIENGKIKGMIPTLANGETKNIYIRIETGNFDDKVNEVPLTMSAIAYVDKKDIYHSNENRRTTYPKYVTLQMSLDKEGEKVKAGEELTYQLEIKNESKIRAEMHVYDNLPKEVQGISLSYETYHIEKGVIDGTTYDIEEEANISYTTEKIEKDISAAVEGKPSVDEYLEIPAGKTVVMTIKAKAMEVIQTKEIANYAVAERIEDKENIGIKTVSSNITKFTLVNTYSEENKDDDNNKGDNEDDPIIVAKPNSISGTAWIDENQNGRRDTSERVLSGVPVSIYDANTQKMMQQTTTNEKGMYAFEKLENGDYWVIFEYDSNQYQVTTYQKRGVLSSLNSDVVAKDITIDGNKKRVAITDTLTIADNGLANIDMGLVSKRSFNLKLDKYISQIEVKTAKGTKVYQYDQSQFTKVEIKAKEIQNSVITVTYTMVVTNPSDTEGFVGEIIDKVPEGYTLDGKQSQGWVKQKDGTVVNTSLSTQFIEPNGKREVKLVLTKKLTENATGTVVNTASIEKIKSTNNLSDNKQEDNTSKAEMLISIETGALTYTIITILGIGGLVGIAILLKGKVKNLLKISVFIFITGTVLTTQVNAFTVYWNSSEVFSGSDGRSYVCGNHGKHLCAKASHSYGGSGSPRDTSTTSTSTEVKDTRMDYAARPSSYQYDNNYNLVGPFTIRTYTDASVANMTMTYTENGQVKQTTNTGVMVKSDGSPMGSTIVANVNYSFFVKVGIDVTAINNITVNVRIANAIQTITTTTGKYYYACTGVASSGHENAKSEAVSVTASGTQGMVTTSRYTISSSTTYSDVIRTATFSTAYVKSTLQIDKKDKDKLENQNLAGIQFTLKMLSGSKAGQYVVPNSIGAAEYHTGETTITTDQNGKITIRLLEPGTYELIETYIPYYGYEEMPKLISSSIVISNGNPVMKYEVNNRRKYVKLSGRVWEDIPWTDGKEEKRNNYLSNTGEEPKDTNDKLLQHVTVRLKDRNENIIPFKDEAGNVLTEIETNAQGEYLLWDILIDKLEEYYIEFTYNGMKYESVPASITKGSVGNKATEGQNRMDYNNQYTSIAAGESRDQNGAKSYNLNYDTQDGESTIRYGANSKYGYQGQKYPINGTEENFLINSTTRSAYDGYLDKIMSADYIRKYAETEIRNINLGVKERPSPDIVLVKDINNVRASINGANHLYRYDDRYNKKYSGDSSIEGMSPYAIPPKVRYQSKYSSMSYTRAVYPSDVYYTKGDAKDQLRIKVTYKIGITNETSLKTIINELDDYYDDKYYFTKDNIVIGTQLDEKTGEIVASSQVPYEIITNSGYNSYYKINIKPHVELEGNSEKYVYVELEVKQEKIREVVEANENDNTEVKLDNIVEIASYSIKDENGNAYAGIDSDSAPGNANITSGEIFEDDTDRAPGLKLILQENRITNGTVFVDKALENAGFNANDVNSGKIRQGNGTYEEGAEVGVAGVTVQLLEKTGQVAQVYNTKTKQWEKAEKITDANGKFEIEGFIPAEYKIAYIWGDKTYKVQDYKGTIYREDQHQGPEWYKQKTPRYSDAKDNYPLRQAIDEQAKLITNRNQKVIDDYTGEIELPDGNKQNLITKMDSTSEIFRVNLEYPTEATYGPDKHTNRLENIDFGIIERAKQALELTKEVKNVKVTLSNGSILMDAQVEDGKLANDVKHAVYLPDSATNGQIKVEIDSEIIQSAKLEIRYKIKARNISELDYLNEQYYYYGSGHGENNQDLVEIDTKNIIDYLDNNIAMDTEQNQIGKIIYDAGQKEELINKGLLENTEQMKNLLIKETNRIFLIDQLTQKLKPSKAGIADNQVETEGEIIVSRLLSNTAVEEGIQSENSAEIIKAEKTGGSSLVTTPGNYIPNETATETDDDIAETVSIVPPTGLTTNYIAYTLLAISSLGILIAGIVLIKKFVLN